MFWTRYFFKVHLIELQENRRKILKKRAAEVASKNENEENNWDDVADLADNPTSNTIPAEVQDLFPNKVALFRQMRAFEYDLKSYIKAKVINVKEDILRKG